MSDSQEFQIMVRPVSELANLITVAGIGQHPDLHDEQLIVCEQFDEPVCFAHVGTGVWANEGCGYLRYLDSGNAHRTLIHATMERAEDTFRKRSIHQMRAGVPDYSYREVTEDGSIALLLLLQRGYKITYGNVNYWMDRLDDCSREIPQDSSLTIVSSPEIGNGQLPNSYIQLQRSGRKIGEAWCFSAWHYGSCKHTQQVFHIGDIDIIEDEQGKGFGRYLLGEAIYEMGKLGYTKVSLSTGVGNLRARLLYMSMGFRQGTTQHILMKDLMESQELNVSGASIYGYPQG